MPDLKLSGMQKDVLTEVMNLGIGRAASVLSELAGDVVDMGIPEVRLMPRSKVSKKLIAGIEGKAAAVRQSFGGGIDGQSLLIFPEKASLELVRRILGEHLDVGEISDLEQDALREVGNVILSACLGAFAEAFGNRIDNGLPEVLVANSGEVVNLCSPIMAEDPEDLRVLFMEVEFGIHSQEIHGYVMLLLGLAGITTLVSLIDEYIKKLSS